MLECFTGLDNTLEVTSLHWHVNLADNNIHIHNGTDIMIPNKPRTLLHNLTFTLALTE